MGDIIGQIGTYCNGKPPELLPEQCRHVNFHNIPRHDFHVVKVRQGLLQHRQQPLIDLHCHHLIRTLCKLRRQHPKARSDLQHPEAGSGVAQFGDPGADCRVDEEILPQPLGKMKAVPPCQILHH